MSLENDVKKGEIRLTNETLPEGPIIFGYVKFNGKRWENYYPDETELAELEGSPPPDAGVWPDLSV